jgi:hypothetical protein
MLLIEIIDEIRITGSVLEYKYKKSLEKGQQIATILLSLFFVI